MLRTTLLLIIAALFMVSCGTEQTKDEAAEVITVAVADFDAQAEELVGKTLAVTGTVSHVCKHGGKKLFLIGDNPENTIKVDAGSAVGAFDIALEGSKIRVEGIVEVLKVDKEYLDNWEGEACAAEKQSIEKASERAEEATGHDDDGDAKGEEHAEADTDAVEDDGTKAQIDEMRKQVAESKHGYLAFYSLQATSFEEIK